MGLETKEAGIPSVALLLAQVGGRAAQKFARLLEPLRFSPPDAGILRLLGHSAGISQQELAKRLGMHASRIVAILDTLEERGLVMRKAHAEDRRAHRLELTETGRRPPCDWPGRAGARRSDVRWARRDRTRAVAHLAGEDRGEARARCGSASRREDAREGQRGFARGRSTDGSI